MTAGRRGRPYQVPEDTSSLWSSHPNVDSRVGWLLLMSRLHHENADLALGDTFNAALREVGLHADRSAVSRWESGKVTPRFSVLLAYERALGLVPGQLTSVVNALRRALSEEELRAWMPIMDPRSEEFQQELDQLFDRLLDAPGTGPDWISLAHHVAATDSMYVQASAWQVLTAKLINEMARSVSLGYLQRFEAVRLLMEDRVAHLWLLRATGHFLSDPAVQIVSDPMGVLEVSESPEAAEQILDSFLTTTSAMVFRAALAAVALKLDGQFYLDEQIELIERHVVRRLREPGGTAQGLEELVLALPERSRQEVLRASRGRDGHEHLAQAAAHGEHVSPEKARSVSQRIADAVQSQMRAGQMYDDDRMTPRLIREALFSVRSQHSHYASIALVGSPFRGPIAARLVHELDTLGLSDGLAVRFMRLLRYLVTADQEEALHGWLPSAPPEVAIDLVLSIGHIDSERPLDDLAVSIRGDKSMLDRAKMYALGMRQSSHLWQIADDDAQPETLRAAAAWWIQQGGAVRY